MNNQWLGDFLKDKYSEKISELSERVEYNTFDISVLAIFALEKAGFDSQVIEQAKKLLHKEYDEYKFISGIVKSMKSDKQQVAALVVEMLVDVNAHYLSGEFNHLLMNAAQPLRAVDGGE